MTRTSPIETNNVVERLIARLRHRLVLQKGETIMLDMGDGPKPVSSGDIVQQRNPDGPEAADLIQSLSDHIDVQSALLGRARWLMRPYCGADEALRIFCDDVTASLEACNAKR